MAPDCCSCCRPLLRLLLVVLLGASAQAWAAPPCSSSPPSVDSVQGLARRASVVIEGKVLAHSVAEPAGGGGGEGKEATSPLPPPPLLILPEEQPSTSTSTAASTSSSSLSGTILSSSSPAPSPPSPFPSLNSPSPPPASSAARVRVHQVWPVKSGGLQKDALLWVLLAERGPACGSSSSSRLKEESRYIFFMEPVVGSSINGTGSPLPPLFRASSPPLETGRSLKKEVSRALCTRGCGRATSEGPSQQSLVSTETNGGGSNYNTVPPKLKEMKSQESAVGQTLVLRCEASSEQPSLKFKWLKNGKEITKKNRPENIKIKSPKKQKTFSELRISRASSADTGEYTCKASNRFGNDSTKAQVIIADANEPTNLIPILTKGTNTSSQLIDKISTSTEGTNASSSTSTSTTGTSHLTRCDVNKKGYCVNGGECFMVKDLPNPPRYLCRCPNEFTGDRCQNYVMASFYKAEELYQKRVLTITGICIALLVVGIMCVVAYCKTKKQRKKLHDRLRQGLRSERNHRVNMANGPHHPHPPPENVQLVNQYVSKNVISSEHAVERETETSFSTSHYTSTTHHSTTVTQTPSHRLFISWSNGRTESIISESHSVLVSSSVENSRHTSPAGPRGRLNGIGGPRECNSFLRHARDTPDSYRDSPHSERYVSAMTTPARMSPVDFHTPSSPKSPASEMSPQVSSLTMSVPSVAVSPFIEEERPLLLVTPPRLREKYEHHIQQFNSSYHHNPAHESNSLPPSPLRIVEDEEYETTQEYEPTQEPPKKLVNSRRAKRTKPNGHIANRLEMDTDTSCENSSSESETEDERIGEDTPFLSIQNPMAADLESATAYRLADTRTNQTSRFSTQEELQARLSSVIANQDPIAV
ncbi:pro-neuregulin-1, membrane-bound isoform isoform X4 [Hemicordylus capensis]|uniref:pro-neuregulin-1, membrane-bound isoform isoform X4 n=1 Tax=Hemicordylus capensis TaxID=884348 RepID=UPI00230239B0|nr:pro-neuregulin-1, membrane-bound isoform isoform X4 [Hemicordylus capensis]